MSYNIDGLKIKIAGSEVKRRLAHSIEKYEAQIGEWKKNETALIQRVDQLFKIQMQTAINERNRLKFIYEFIDENANYILPWGDVASLGTGFYETIKPEDDGKLWDEAVFDRVKESGPYKKEG